MDHNDRKRIELCCDSLVPRINMNKLWPKLLEYGVYEKNDVNISRWKRSLMDPNTVRDIYLTVKTRGPYAFKYLLKSLRQSEHEPLADELERRVVNNNGVANNGNKRINNRHSPGVVHTPGGNFTKEPSRDDNFYANIQNSDEPLKITVRKADRFIDGPEYDKVQRYPMRSKPRGLVLLITNITYAADEPRISAAHDRDNLKILFEEMGFSVIPKDDLTGEDLRAEVEAFSQLEDLRKVDSCFVIVTSHGAADENDEEETVIHGIDYAPNVQDYKKVLCKDLMGYFTAEACPHLAGKPKIFIFQLCRGPKRQKAVRVERYTQIDGFGIKEGTRENRISNKGTIRNYQDMLVVYSTLPGHVAYRDNVTGSWLIQILCEVFMNHAHDTHLQDLFHIVDDRLQCLRAQAEECQTLIMEYKGFSKHCYINPGLFP